MPRKPSASHCVQKLPLDLYRPSRLVFSCVRAGCFRILTVWGPARAGSKAHPEAAVVVAKHHLQGCMHPGMRMRLKQKRFS